MNAFIQIKWFFILNSGGYPEKGATQSIFSAKRDKRKTDTLKYNLGAGIDKCLALLTDGC